MNESTTPERRAQGENLITLAHWIDTLAAANAALTAAQERIAGLESRLAVLESREAERAKKLSGFFAPVKNAGNDTVDDPLPGSRENTN